jgi:hypothetical protein
MVFSYAIFALFGLDTGYEKIAKSYEKGRPEYPEEAVQSLASALLKSKRVLQIP